MGEWVGVWVSPPTPCCAATPQPHAQTPGAAQKRLVMSEEPFTFKQAGRRKSVLSRAVSSGATEARNNLLATSHSIF